MILSLFGILCGVGKTKTILVGVEFSAFCCVCHFVDVVDVEGEEGKKGKVPQNTFNQLEPWQPVILEGKTIVCVTFMISIMVVAKIAYSSDVVFII